MLTPAAMIQITQNKSLSKLKTRTNTINGVSAEFIMPAAQLLDGQLDVFRLDAVLLEREREREKINKNRNQIPVAANEGNSLTPCVPSVS
jgi:hypothetical protein